MNCTSSSLPLKHSYRVPLPIPDPSAISAGPYFSFADSFLQALDTMGTNSEHWFAYANVERGDSASNPQERIESLFR